MQLKQEEYGGTEIVIIQSCEVFNNKAFIVRTAKNESGKGDHPLTIIEIVSDINFREKYNIKDGDEIEIII